MRALAAEFEVSVSVATRTVGIVETNSLSTAVGSGLYPVLSCASHSCAYNCVMVHPDGDPSNSPAGLGFAAIRDIVAGEEITISYMLHFNVVDEAGLRVTKHLSECPTHVRQMYLQRGCNFSCRCMRCADRLGSEDINAV